MREASARQEATPAKIENSPPPSSVGKHSLYLHLELTSSMDLTVADHFVTAAASGSDLIEGQGKL